MRQRGCQRPRRYDVRGRPGLAVAGAATALVVSFVFGSHWFDRGDAFEVWSALFGRLSVLGHRGDGRVVVRSPLVGLARRSGGG